MIVESDNDSGISSLGLLVKNKRHCSEVLSSTVQVHLCSIWVNKTYSYTLHTHVFLRSYFRHEPAHRKIPSLLCFGFLQTKPVLPFLVYPTALPQELHRLRGKCFLIQMLHLWRHTWRFGRQRRWGKSGWVCWGKSRPTSSEKASYQATLERLHKGCLPSTRVSEQLQFDPRLWILRVPQLLDEKPPVGILKFKAKKKLSCGREILPHSKLKT